MPLPSDLASLAWLAQFKWVRVVTPQWVNTWDEAFYGGGVFTTAPQSHVPKPKRRIQRVG